MLARCIANDANDRLTLKKTILVTTAGSAIGYYLLGCANKIGIERVIAGDTNPPELVSGSLSAAKYIQLPLAKDKAFLPFIKKVLLDESVDYWIPILDEEIVQASRIKLEDDAMAKKIHAPNQADAALCLDKYRLAVELTANGFPQPRTQLLKNAEWKKGGVFIKPRFGRGSIGARLCTSEDDFNNEKKQGDDLIVQEVLFAPEITVDAYVPLRGGKTHALCRERLEVKSGVCTKARVFYDANLENIAQRLADLLKLKGPFCFQLMSNLHDEKCITDVNPRLGAGTALSAEVGFDAGAAFLCDLIGLPYETYLNKLPASKYVLRSYVEHVI